VSCRQVVHPATRENVAIVEGAVRAVGSEVVVNLRSRALGESRPAFVNVVAPGVAAKELQPIGEFLFDLHLKPMVNGSRHVTL
jgi:hypothetical protein